MSRWDERKNAIIEMYREGRSTRAIASAEMTTAPTICKYLSRWGITRRRTPHGGRIGSVQIKSGDRFGELTVLRYDRSEYPGKWACQCSCGKFTKVTAAYLKQRRSCGCMRGRRKEK